MSDTRLLEFMQEVGVDCIVLQDGREIDCNDRTLRNSLIKFAENEDERVGMLQIAQAMEQ